MRRPIAEDRLALPLKRAGGDEADFIELDGQSLTRYSIGELDVRDSNASTNQTSVVQVARLRMRLMRRQDATDAYTTLGIVQVTERRADNEVLLRKSFIPPALHTANDPVLSSYARELHGKLHQQAEALAGKITQLGRGGVAEIGRFLMLQTVNRYEALFAHLTSHSLLHPERLYAACVQLAGGTAPIFPETSGFESGYHEQLTR